jgi:hypothetical protein
MAANDKQVAGDHYKAPIECWDYILANNIGYLEGTAIKYLTRWRKKGGLNDIKKAIHFLEKLVEVEEAKTEPHVTITGVHHQWVQMNMLDEAMEHLRV